MPHASGTLGRVSACTDAVDEGTRRRGSGRVRAERNFPAREGEAFERGRVAACEPQGSKTARFDGRPEGLHYFSLKAPPALNTARRQIAKAVARSRLRLASTSGRSEESRPLRSARYVAFESINASRRSRPDGRGSAGASPTRRCREPASGSRLYATPLAA
jgi:hypothetical protein